jgi:dUTP pyrophosphatase
MVIAPVVQAELVPVVSLSATDRGSGGFGSTGR